MDQSPTLIDAVPAIRLETGEVLSTREHYDLHAAGAVPPVAASVAAQAAPEPTKEEDHGTA